ncbi:MAG: hypothetical protein LC734_06695, partial [Acidobacteria bacterium]|nr:hypothetical protein [Acidobacteriota bacterium]
MNPQPAQSPPKESVRILLTGIIDYAGVFPPSQISMPEAVANFAKYQISEFGWMLGRFVLPVARLGEFLETAEGVAGTSSDGWRLSALASEDIVDTIRRINLFNAAHAPRFVCDTVEVKANTISKIENTVNSLPQDLTAFFEISTDRNFADLVATLSIKKQRAKIRTGGISNDAFPTSREIIRFVRTCLAANVPYKATAGLHHPLRCFKPLTYAENGPQGTMHGFLNLLLMTGFARESFRVQVLEQLMEEEFEEAFTFEEGGVRY